MKKKIGIVGAGQAGQRIAIALSKFPDVEVKGIVDPKSGRDILSGEDSPWKISSADFYSDDDEMLNAHPYDGLIIAADPISAYRYKSMALARNNVSAPVLWERPVGVIEDHPEQMFAESKIDYQSVISFGRFGVTTKAIQSLAKSGELGNIIDFEITGTLNCGLKNKSWRHGEEAVLLPTHFLDTAFEIIETAGLGEIKKVEARSKFVSKEDINFDEKWEISLETATGISGRIIGIQYAGDSEFLYPCRSIRIIGDKGAFISILGSSVIIKNDGSVVKVINESQVDERNAEAITSMKKYFREVDNYPQDAPCGGEAVALVDCLRNWVDSLDDKSRSLQKNLCNAKDAARYNMIASTVIESAATGKSIDL